MQKISRKRLEFASQAFLTAMVRQFFALNPDAEECPIKTLTDYPEDQRSALMRGIGAAIKSTGAEDDASFNTWVAQQTPQAA
ncbi:MULTISPECIES: hypothetical protein [unclassified Ensifer]|uniref:hypothetical protein n=1 Tax=unclassified Ensifer TaxID=2633371 RepID=UPI00081354E0|nr:MULTISPECIES: hypothetical protein [unclassified Ensifer]OCP21965.1 hypothetical protein BC361_25695 [Ensifer sp. LC54]OCP23255.1 hypothetical protein BC363_25070 [Ensifer sp. LC384]